MFLAQGKLLEDGSESDQEREKEREEVKVNFRMSWSYK